MSRKPTLRQSLRELVVEHPDWTYRQYAEALGQTVDSVRGAMSKMGLSTGRQGRPTKRELEERKTNIEKMKVADILKDPAKYRAAARSGPRMGGYIKLL